MLKTQSHELSQNPTPTVLSGTVYPMTYVYPATTEAGQLNYLESNKPTEVEEPYRLSQFGTPGDGS